MALDLAGVRRSIHKLRKLLEKARSRPSPAKVHDLRTHTRRFEVTVEAFGLGDRRHERRLLSDLGKLRKRAGSVRDMDVLTGYAATVSAEGEQDCLVELLEYLGAERYRHARRLRTLLRQDGTALRRRLKRTCKRIERLIPADGGHESDENRVVRKQAMATALRLSGELLVPGTLSRKTLHPYRLKVKDLRNVLKMATDADGKGFVAQLGDVKDAIGEWHDWEALLTVAAERLNHGTRCRLLREVRAIGDRKYERALSLTNRMRREYLRLPRHRRVARASAGPGPATPVLEATAAMAT